MNNRYAPITVFNLLNTEAARVDYEGCGWSILIVRDGNPAAIIYLPHDLSGKTFEQVAAEVDFSAITWEDGARDITEAYVGMCSDYEFVAFMRLGEPDYKTVAHEDDEIIIEHITRDLYVTGYKSERQRVAVRLSYADFNGVASWALNYKPRAEIYTRYTEDNSERRGIVRLLDDDGEVTHTLESRGDGAYSEDGTPFGWCVAALEAYDSEGDFLQSYTLGYITEFDAKRWAY